jgi:hypothetical protein
MEQGWQDKKAMVRGGGSSKGCELVVPNPKLKLMDQVREVLRRHVVDSGELIVDRAVPEQFGGQRARGGLDPKSGI